MGMIETFDHTADVGLRIWGDNDADLFQTAAEGLMSYIVVNRDDVRPLESESLTLQADSTMDLLIAWLSELIFRVETRHRLYSRFDVRVAIDGLSLEAEIAGEPMDRERHVLDHEVKAVTHHGLVLERDGARRRAEIILDI